jgi:hypothetical protein
VQRLRPGVGLVLVVGLVAVLALVVEVLVL